MTPFSGPSPSHLFNLAQNHRPVTIPGMTTLPPLHNPPGQSVFAMNRLPFVPSLMSPPEPKPFDTFHSAYSSLPMASDSSVKLPPISDDRKRNRSDADLPSPPVTPYTGNKKRKSNADQIEPEAAIATSSNRDPVLFPRNEPVADVHNDEPLFGPVLVSAAEALIDQHMNSPSTRFQNKVNKPTRDEYMLALSCVPIVATQYNRNPLAWAKEERETLERQMAMMDRVDNRPANFKRLAPAPAKKATGHSQPRAAKPARPRRTPKSTPKQRVLDTFDVEYSPSTKPIRVIGTNRDDTDYNSLTDYAPSLETLHGNTKGLKADWKGQMLDLSNDPDRHLLDPAEVSLAATLRLSCATYLCSKRRIFEARVKALSIGKEFRKTDAQQACKIDVNKASKLWTAYDRVGWFKPEHFVKYLK